MPQLLLDSYIARIVTLLYANMHGESLTVGPRCLPKILFIVKYPFNFSTLLLKILLQRLVP